MALGQLRTHRLSEDGSHEKDNTAEALAAWGLQPSAIPPVSQRLFYLWPENVEPFELWVALQTQWRSGMGGQTGLDYCAVESVFRMSGVPRKQHALRFAQIRDMERTVLAAWEEKRELERR